MKKSLLFLVAIFLSFVLQAQEFGKTDFGVKGGLNLTNIGGQETDNLMKTGANLGVYASSHFLKPVNFQLELMFSSQGHAPKTDLDPKLKLSCLNIPLTVQYYLKDKISIHAGPQFGFLLGANAKYQDITYDMKDQFHGFDLGLALGASYDFSIAGRDLNVTLRYIHGLTNISQSVPGRFNRVLQASLGIKLYEMVQ